jgi:hypothetical protein
MSPAVYSRRPTALMLREATGICRGKRGEDWVLALAIGTWALLGLLAVVIVAGFTILGTLDKLNSNHGNGNGNDD